ncbi:UTRA domain-containing protein [Pokkaliibacter sp. MBI-7]|uniref:UTRA domain-containing protein n=1 Tax=Pokkaliibacter sp. MBI-7 TaxID=3040600 RepID=UPI0024471855|nr:UTRA domain-containing protein [Pokkaliibacter sp. MBI-7]MDH2433210.1 UTRA domain-containing protein [Pokkaliibacter sp. MBI-7]
MSTSQGQRDAASASADDTENSRTPFYLQLRDRIAAQIATGQLSAHSRLPSERTLSEQYQTTRVTARLALGQLEAEGKLYRSNRRGWFVSPERIIYDPSLDVSFTDYVTKQGGVPRTETLQSTSLTVPVWLAQKSGLEEGSEIYHIQRRRYIDGRAILTENIYVNPAVCPGLLRFDFNQSLWKLMRHEYGVSLSDKHVTMYPTALTDPQAGILGVTPGTAGLYVNRISRNSEGVFIEFDEEFWLHDALCISVHAKG